MEISHFKCHIRCLAYSKNQSKDLFGLRSVSEPGYHQIGKPSINPGQIVGLRLIAKDKNKQSNDICVILASESGECMRLEAGGMARMELIEQVVPIQKNSLENDVARLLSSSRGNTSPLLASATPIAKEMLDSANQAK